MNPSTQISSEIKNETTSSEQTATFVNDKPTVDVAVKQDPVSVDPQLYPTSDDTPLAGKLERPVLAFKTIWTPSTTATHYDLPAIFLNHPLVQNTIDKFKLLRGTFVFRFVINGTPFHYGRFLMAWEPGLTIGEMHDDSHVVSLSQCPHVLLSPTSNTTMEMRVPFSCNKYWFDLTSTTGARLGVLHAYPLNQLNMANSGAVDDVTISCFVHMEDVQLQLPTSTSPVTYSAMAGKGKKPKSFADEYGTGPVSAPASAVAAVAGRLQDVPVIGRFATATQIGASAIANIAKLFGFSSPTIIEDHKVMRMRYFSPLALTSGGDTSMKLSLDPKQELSVDSRLIDLDGTDQMSFDFIKSVPSFLKTFTWALSDAPEDSLIHVPITPALAIVGATTGGGIPVDFTPMGKIAACFKAWTGCIDVHVQIVCSAYHKGRLRVTWVPEDPTSFDPNNYNDALTQIIDITDTTEYMFRVGWGQAVPYRSLNTYYEFDGNPATQGYFNQSQNGTLVISVVNQLTAPDSTADAQINIWVKGGPDLEFQCPTQLRTDLLSGTATAMSAMGAVPRTLRDEDEDVCCEHPSEFYVNPPRDGLPLAHYGEQIKSLRTMYKRFQPWVSTFTADLTAGNFRRSSVGTILPRFPVGPGGPTPGAAYFHRTATNNTPHNFTTMTYMAWFQSMYLGYRGSVRYKFVDLFNNTEAVAGSHAENTKTYTTFSRRPLQVTQNLIGYLSEGYNTADLDGPNCSEWISETSLGSNRGGVEVVPNTSGQLYGFEIELPDYNPTLYHPYTDYLLDADERMDVVGVVTTTYGYHYVNGPHLAPMLVYAAAGEDFNQVFFKGAKRVWVQYDGISPDLAYKPANNFNL